MVARPSELDPLALSADRVRSGESRVVVVLGEPGTGTSWVLATATAALFDFTVIRCDGLETDAQTPGAWFEALGALLGVPADVAPVIAELRRLATLGPVCVAVDDSHWLDERSSAALQTVVRGVRGSAILVVVVSKTAESRTASSLGRREASGNGGAIVQVHPFDLAQTAQLLHEHGLTEVPRPTIARLCELTAGVPLHLVSVIEADRVALRSGVPNPLPLPDSFRSRLSADLALLSPEGRRALDLVALADGHLTTADLLATAETLGWDVSIDDARSAPHLRTADGTDTRLAIDFAPMRELLRSEIPAQTRRTAHAALAARAVGETRLGYLLAAMEGPDESVAVEFEDRAETLSRSGLYSEAVGFLSAAARATPAPELRRRRLVGAVSLALLATDGEAARSLRPSLERKLDGRVREVALATVEVLNGEYAAAAARLGRTAHLPPPGDDFMPRPSFDRLTTAVAATASWGVGDVRGVLTVTAGDHWTGTGLDARIRLYQAYGRWFAGDADGARTSLAPMLVDVPHRPEHSDAANLLAQQHFYAGDLASATAAFDSVTVASSATGGQVQLALCGRALTALAAGRWSDAIDDANRVLELTGLLGGGDDDCVAHVVLAIIAAAADRLDEGAAHAETARRLAHARPLAQNIGWAAIASAVVATAHGRHADTVRFLRPLTEGALDHAARVLAMTQWVPLLAAALAEQGKPDEADQVLDTYRSPVPPFLGHPEWARAVIAAARGAQAEAIVILTALTDSTDESTPLATALALRTRAAVADVAGRRADADRDRRQARLLTMGARPSPEEPRGEWAILTDRERECVALAADGLTNREIAAALHVSVKTVEYHLGRALGRLGLTSRRQLRAR